MVYVNARENRDKFNTETKCLLLNSTQNKDKECDCLTHVTYYEYFTVAYNIFNGTRINSTIMTVGVTKSSDKQVTD